MNREISEAMNVFTKTILEYDRLIKSVPSTTEGFENILRELAEAERGCLNHLKRYPIGSDDVIPPESKEGWRKCYNAKNKAIRNLIDLALLRFPEVEHE